MKAKTIQDYLPKRKPERVLIQAKIEEKVHSVLKTQLEKDGITLQDLLNASIIRYLDEKKVSY